MRQVPHAPRRGGQGRPRPHRHGRPPQGASCSSTSSTRAAASRGTSSSTPSPPRDGRVLNGLLASRDEDRRSSCSTPRGRSTTILREDIDELAASKKSLMPEGFEKQVPPEGAGRPAGVPRPDGASTCRSTSARRDGRQHQGDVLRHGRDRRAAGLPRLVAQDVRGRAVRARRPAGRPRAERGPALRPAAATIPPKMPKSVSLPVQRAGQGDPPPQRRQRLGLPGGPRGDGLDDRPPPLRRRHDRGPPAEERRPLRRLHPARRRARLEARLQAPRPADPLPGRRARGRRRRSPASSWSRAPTAPPRSSWR